MRKKIKLFNDNSKTSFLWLLQFSLAVTLNKFSLAVSLAVTVTVLLAVRMVADVTETRIEIPSLEFEFKFGIS